AFGAGGVAAGERVDGAGAVQAVHDRIRLAAVGGLGHERLRAARGELGRRRPDADHVTRVVAALAEQERQAGLRAEIQVALVVEAARDDVGRALEPEARPADRVEPPAREGPDAGTRLL